MKKLDLRDFELMEDLIEDQLEKYPQTRDNDDLLYWAVCCYLIGKDTMEFINAKELLFRRKELGLPPRTSVTRNRNYVQARRPELRGSEYDIRMQEEKDCREAYRR